MTQRQRLRRGGGLAVLILVVLFATTVPLGDWLSWTQEWIDDQGSWGPILFLIAYILSCVLCIPGSALTVAGGAVFGLSWGFILVSVSSTAGAVAAFLTGRYVARGWVEEWIQKRPRFVAVNKAVEEQGLWVVFLTRLSPLFPFVFLNYAYGVTRVRFRDYLLASWVGMMPGTVLYVFVGATAGAGLSEHDNTSGTWALRLLGLAATIVVTVWVTKIARKAFESGITSEESGG
ncbi:MAG: TVP38/TMEM64 family protein [Planctomycetota bacterium]|nr:TVP38/TMEM64 family protein [Planctomycetota bacterium]